MPDDNIIEFEKPRSEKKPPQKPSHPPLINLPPVTKYILLTLIAIHVLIAIFFSAADQASIFVDFGFVPALWTNYEVLGFEPLSLITPITYIFLHGNWLHLFMNGAMLMAFGAGVEPWLGAKRYLVFLLLCGLIALLPELLIHPFSQTPLVGASGALSGLFAAILILLQRQNRLPAGKYGIWPFASIWIGISVIFGLVGEQMAGAPIAWLAHIGGFLGGFILLKLRYFQV